MKRRYSSSGLSGISRGKGREISAADIAMAEAEFVAAVIARLIAEGVEEEPVDIVFLETFGQDFHGLVTVIAAVDASGIKTVINGRGTVGFAEKPFRDERRIRLCESC